MSTGTERQLISIDPETSPPARGLSQVDLLTKAREIKTFLKDLPTSAKETFREIQAPTFKARFSKPLTYATIAFMAGAISLLPACAESKVQAGNSPTIPEATATAFAEQNPGASNKVYLPIAQGGSKTSEPVPNNKVETPKSSPPPPVPNTPTSVARAFFSELTKDDAISASKYMSAAAVAEHGSRLTAIAKSLQACKNTTAEFSVLGNNEVIARLTPGCGNYGQFLKTTPEVNNSTIQYMLSQYGHLPLTLCDFAVNVVNEQWKVVGPPSCSYK